MLPLLHFNFKKENGKDNPFLFESPIKVFSASTIDEVIPLLEEIETMTNKGYYAAGYLSYEAAPAFDKAFKVNSDSKMPILWFGIFKEPQQISLQSFKEFHTNDWKVQTEANEYNKNIDQIKDYIEQGVTYQVNYTVRMRSNFTGDSIAYYNKLSQAQAANYSAYLNTGDYTAISASPELFFHLKDGKVTTKPMKGTIDRGKNREEDQSKSAWLYHSEKNRAENVMIVDLLRNDLGMIARQGSVAVPSLYAIEEYPTVYQMTSTVTAEISSDKTIMDIFKALFPCGSITGAPKISTMEIINQLENSPRNVYCGAIGYITPEKEAIFNVPIRTVLIENDTGNAEYGVGGGITWDSINQEEFSEVFMKAKVLDVKPDEFNLLESFGLEDGDYIVLENHLNRMNRTAEFFDFRMDSISARRKLEEFAADHPSGKWKVRLLSNRSGDLFIEGNQITAIHKPVVVSLANSPVSKDNVFLRYKTTNRAIYDDIRIQSPDVYDVLLWNEDREITEFTTGNIVVELDEQMYTPPLDSGLLAGTFREDLLENGMISEKKITMEELKGASRIWLINSVRKWVPVHMKKAY
ncbi:aminodeoxychorismate synthase component I [Oceanobacillus massiliensis]|uniref:aminodeoxychorismate synthase component I n=1 Tax=Oceanobacillus massiliensis TaxID=1465765 RepID=UPI000289A4F6|nr:aminodeoxychorismate synthase component I [Oceanobacillus massiliensis]